jgi:hypothetical protein
MPRSRRKPKAKPRLLTDVCKPCWELKYCPYGPLVEQFPLVIEEPFFDRSDRTMRKLFNGVLKDLKRGKLKTEAAIMDAVGRLEYLWPPRWKFIKQFRTEELSCNVFGHICPVFLTAEGFTETKGGRTHSRTIPRDVMLKVVRRDDGICQICFQPVKDDEVQFDHLIPHSRGGPASIENLRLVHARCNKRKRDSLSEILEPARVRA